MSLALGASAGAYIVAGASFKHTQSGGEKGKQQSQESTVGTLTAVEALTISMQYHVC